MLPFLELGGGDERSPQVTVAHSLGLPPGGILLAYNLENVPPPKRKARLLARRGFVLIRCVVEQSSQVNLKKKQQKTHVMFAGRDFSGQKKKKTRLIGFRSHLDIKCKTMWLQFSSCAVSERSKFCVEGMCGSAVHRQATRWL